MNVMKLSELRKRLELYDEHCALQLLRDTVESKISQVRNGENSRQQFPDLPGMLCVIDNLELSESERNPAITKASFWTDSALQAAVLKAIFDCENQLNTVLAVVHKLTGVNKSGTH